MAKGDIARKVSLPKGPETDSKFSGGELPHRSSDPGFFPGDEHLRGKTRHGKDAILPQPEFTQPGHNRSDARLTPEHNPEVKKGELKFETDHGFGEY